MQLHSFVQIVHQLLPPQSALAGDAVGLQVESKRQTATTVLVALEVTPLVVNEARELGADVLVVFHPLIYRPLHAVTHTDRVGYLVAELIRSDIALLSVHTTFDVFPQGTNHVLAHRLNLVPVKPLASLTSSSSIGLVADLPTALSVGEFLDRLSAVCGSPVRYTKGASDVVRRVALVGGSGMEWFAQAVESEADVFITADIKYHAFIAAQGVITLADPGHYEMEQFVPEALADTLRSTCTDLNIITSSVNTNPLRYHSPLSTAIHSPVTGQS